MKCKFLNALAIMNPLWSQVDSEAARRAGKPYAIPQQIEVGAGYIAEDPQAWIHCCPGDLNSAPIAEPADEECVEAVRVWMEEKRPEAIKLIAAQLDQIDTLKDPEDKKRLLAMGKAYGLLGDKKKPAADGVKA